MGSGVAQLSEGAQPVPGDEVDPLATWPRQRFAEHGSVQGVVRSPVDLLPV